MIVVLGTCCDSVCILAKEVNSNPAWVDGLSAWVVKTLMKGSENKGNMFLDSFYFSVSLFEDHWQNGAVTHGTVQVNRKGLPIAMRYVKMNLDFLWNAGIYMARYSRAIILSIIINTRLQRWKWIQQWKRSHHETQCASPVQ